MGARTLITTVVTAATAPSGGVRYDLTSLAAVKTELKITTGEDDAYFGSLISRASAAAMSYCNRVFAQETVTDEFWAQRDPAPAIIRGGYERLQLSRWPIIAITSVIDNGDVLVSGTDYRADNERGQLTRMDGGGRPVAWSSAAISVTYSAGYATIPYDVVDAVIRMVKSRWFMRKRDAGLRQQNIPGVLEQTFWIATGSEAGAFTPDIADLLDGYRVPVVTA